MLAYTLHGAKLSRGIDIKVPEKPSRAQRVLKGHPSTLALVPSLASHGGSLNWESTIRFRKVEHTKVPGRTLRGHQLILREIPRRKTDKALLLITNRTKQMGRCTLIPNKDFTELTDTKLVHGVGDILCECSPGANIVIVDKEGKTNTRYVWNGKAFSKSKETLVEETVPTND